MTCYLMNWDTELKKKSSNVQSKAICLNWVVKYLQIKESREFMKKLRILLLSKAYPKLERTL